MNKNRFNRCENEVTDQVLAISELANKQKTRSNRMSMKARVNTLKKKFDLYVSAYQEYMDTLEEEDDRLIQREAKKKMETSYFEVLGIGEVFIEEVDTIFQLNNSEPNTSEKTTTEIEMPIPIPTFDGTITKWLDWKACFLDGVHMKNNYTAFKKMMKLKAALTGKAASIIEGIIPNEAGYDQAWRLLDQYFSNYRLIIKEYLHMLLNFPVMRYPSELKDRLIDIRKCIRSLEACGQEVSKWDTILVYVISETLDPVTKRDFEIEYPSKERLPEWKQLETFMENRAIITTNAMTSTHQIIKQPVDTASVTSRSSLSTKLSGINKTNYKCFACAEFHRLHMCNIYKLASIEERKQILLKSNACLNCLSIMHKTEKCIREPNCALCDEKHHSSLHPNPPKKSQWYTEKVLVKATVTKNEESQNIRLLPTAQINIKTGQYCGKIRVLLDNCSQSHLVSEGFVKKHRLPVKTVAQVTEVCGIGGGYNSNQTCEILLRSNTGEEYKIYALVIPAAINYFINTKCNPHVELLQNIELADGVYKQKQININGIDLLLGSEIYEEVLTNESKLIPPFRLRSSKFGWLLSNIRNTDWTVSNQAVVTTASCVELQLEKYWEIDRESDGPRKNEETYCEQHFKENTTRVNGIFVVRYPFLQSKPLEQLLNNYRSIQFINKKILERLDDEKRVQYQAFLNEYEELGHMNKILNKDWSHYHFIPHHAVVRESSTTTKLRVVFNASWTNKCGFSLNDCMAVGPVVQPELIDSLLRFRIYKVAFSADVKQMYRCIKIHEEDRRYQCIFGLNQQPYILNTVTYGTASAPFLATRCLKQLADENELENPRASKIIRSAYMDDILGGDADDTAVIKLRKEIHNILENAGFQLRKYQSNSKEVLQSIPEDLVEKQTKISIGGEESLSILGILWVPEADKFQLQTRLDDQLKNNSKRYVLSEIAKLFDPMSLAAPVTVRGKILMQKIWRAGISWDERLPDEFLLEFQQIQTELRLLGEKLIPRFLGDVNSSELVGYCDASLMAYGACVYLRSPISKSEFESRLIIAKSRVAPIKKTMTIPKLELQAAVELVKLVQRVATAYNITKDRIILISDSRVALSWIIQPNKKWSEFVKNRVIEINNIFPYNCWQYCNTRENPADLLTRGISTKDWIKSELWFSGPPVLKTIQFKKENYMLQHGEEDTSEMLHVSVNTITIPPENTLLLKIEAMSNYGKCIRIIGLVVRFVAGCRKKKLRRIEGDRYGLNMICKLIQQKEYKAEYQILKENKSLGSRSKLLKFNPYLDTENILRSASRLRAGIFQKNRARPMILPANHIFIKNMIRHVHTILLHSPTGIIEEYLWNYYVFTGSIRKKIRSVIHVCVQCNRLKNQNMQQIMAALPKERLQMNRAFYITGLDCAGPFTIRCTNHRSMKHLKYYLVVFVCFSSRAVHLEMIASLSTSDFLLALENFINRRGRPIIIYSDNATNFKGVANRLEFTDEKLQQSVVEKGLEWRFNLPGTPHRGGLWESAVKAAKQRLLYVLKDQVLTAEQLYYCFVKVEAILNSRPLTYRTNVENEHEVITPGHLLIGDNLLCLPDLKKVSPISITRQYENILQRIKDFWNVWKKDYINLIAVRYKWKRPIDNVKIGQIVLVKKIPTAEFKWPLGRIIETIADHQGAVRTAKVNVNGKIEVVAIQHLAPLPLEDNDSAGGESVLRTCAAD